MLFHIKANVDIHWLWVRCVFSFTSFQTHFNKKYFSDTNLFPLDFALNFPVNVTQRLSHQRNCKKNKKIYPKYTQYYSISVYICICIIHNILKIIPPIYFHENSKRHKEPNNTVGQSQFSDTKQYFLHSYYHQLCNFARMNKSLCKAATSEMHYPLPVFTYTIWSS